MNHDNRDFFDPYFAPTRAFLPPPLPPSGRNYPMQGEPIYNNARSEYDQREPIFRSTSARVTLILCLWSVDEPYYDARRPCRSISLVYDTHYLTITSFHSFSLPRTNSGALLPTKCSFSRLRTRTLLSSTKILQRTSTRRSKTTTTTLPRIRGT